MAAARLRRDGFVSLETVDGVTSQVSDRAVPAVSVLLTRPLIFNAEQGHLFVNAEVAAGGFLQLAVLAGNGSAAETPLPGYALAQSTVADRPPNQCTATPVDSTRAEVRWADGRGLGGRGGHDDGESSAVQDPHRGWTVFD